MATASPTPMPSGYDDLYHRVPSRPLLPRMPPARPNLRRGSPLSNAYGADSYAHRHASNNSINDSSDDEDAIPKLSAAAEEILGVRTEERKAREGVLGNSEHRPRYREGSPIAKEVYRTSQLLGRERPVSPLAHDYRSPRIVKLSGGRTGSGSLRRAMSIAETSDGSPLAKRGVSDLKTPAPRPKSTIGESSGSPRDVADYSNKASSGGSGLAGTSTHYRTKTDDGGAANSIRVKRIGKVTGSFLSGPARRGMIRRQSEEEHLPYTTGDDQPKADDEWIPKSNLGSQHPSPVNGEEKQVQRVHFAQVSDQPADEPANPKSPHIHKEKAPDNDAIAIPFRSVGSSLKRSQPVFKPTEVPHLPSNYDQENVPPPTFKRDKPGLDILVRADKPRHDDFGRKAQLAASPSRKPLAPKTQNTPLRPAPPPPPPKMSVLETATATAGAASAVGKKKVRNIITVNGKQFSRMECIGRGGSGRVHKVMAENFKLFALKSVSLENLDELTICGFKGEIELLRKLQNVDRVVRLYDFEINEEKKVLRVLMDIGELDLKKILDPYINEESGKLNITFTQNIWREMLECVAAVHAFDIVHSDLKPANFVLVQGQLKLIDFGIANAIQDDTVNVHREQQVGTPNYMSPETLVDTNVASNGRRVSGANAKLMKVGKPSDIWSLGCILYQIVYGKLPFSHIQNNMRKVMAITDPSHAIAFPAVGVGGVSVPACLLGTLRKCLDRDASRRPTVEQLLGPNDLFLNPHSPDAVPVSQELMGRIMDTVFKHVEQRGLPGEEDRPVWKAHFFARIKAAVEEGRA